MNAKLTHLIVALLLVCGCAQPPTQEDPAVLAKQAIERSQARYDESRAAGHAWLPTRVSLDKAKHALQAGDFSAARAEAERAEALAKASIAQAQTEQTAWQERFPTVRSSTE